MNKIDKTMLILYSSTVTLALAIYAYFELIDNSQIGCLYDAQDRTLRTVFEVASIFTTMAFVFASLRLIGFKKIRERIQTEPAYLTFCKVRWAMISFALLLNELTFFLFCSGNVQACIPVCGIALFFVWPSSARRVREMGLEEVCEDETKKE